MINEFEEILNILEQYKNSKNQELLSDIKDEFNDLAEVKAIITRCCQKLKIAQDYKAKLGLLVELRIALMDIDSFVLSQIEYIEQVIESLVEANKKVVEESPNTIFNMVKKNKELFIENNNIYIIASTEKYIITNNRYKGLFIFNRDLEKIKDLELNDVLCQSFYACEDNEKLLILSDRDDITKLILIDLKTFSIKEKKIENELFFSRFYLWDENNIILIDSSEDTYYSLDLINLNLKKVDKNYIANKYKNFFALYTQSKNYNVMQFYPKMMAFTFFDYYNYQAGLYSHNTIKKTDKIDFDPDDPFNTPHDVIFYNNYFIIIAQNYLIIETNQIRHKITGDDKFSFIRASFLKNNSSFVALLNDKSRHFENKLIIYQLPLP